MNKLLSELSKVDIIELRKKLKVDPAVSDDEIVDDGYGWGLVQSQTSIGEKVERGDMVRVTAVDPRILEHLPDDEVSELKSFIGEMFPVVHINFDGSLLIEKEWTEDGEVLMGHGLAVFPGQYELVSKDDA